MTQQQHSSNDDTAIVNNANVDNIDKESAKSIASHTKSPSLVPKGITIGLALFSLILSSVAFFGIRLINGEEFATIFSHAIILMSLIVAGIPIGFWIGSLVMNKITGSHIQTRNALTLGWLSACVTMLWLMGVYS